ncbi:uncharacterized protein LOC128215862 [Mya arenaria]|uniref:uncharacterized protein LOC128215862 n=1 Tax=Mya arenaria TaxID=6604 RepID=UPI0022E89224|nr:uncharacterized protein LOC128215862 [Mya arenaria]
MTVTVANSESCYTTTCKMDVEVFYTNWPPTICSINGTGSHTSLHEDTDSETLLHELQVCDYNYDRPSDLLEVGKVNGIEDNATCWIEHVYDQWGDNDMELFTLREDNSSYTNKWDSYRLYKKECIVPGSPYTPPCGYKRENYTCPKHTGCMTHNVTQSYNVSIICRDGYGESDNRNFTFYVNSNQAPTYLNLPNEVFVDMNTASEHDIIFSILYRDAEKENLTYEYSFIKEDDLSPVDYFKADSSGNYFDSLGTITFTQFLKYEPKNSTYLIHICGHERRNEICEYLTVHLHGGCYQTPNCTDQNIPELWDTHGIDGNYSLFQMIIPQPAYHFPYFRRTWSKLMWTLDNGGFAEAEINSDTALSDEITLSSSNQFVIETMDRNENDTVDCRINNEADDLPFRIEETFFGSDGRNIEMQGRHYEDLQNRTRSNENDTADYEDIESTTPH